ERLASPCQCRPRIPQACIMFALVGIVCFLRQRCALGGRFPRGLTLGSHLVLSISTSSPPASNILRPPRLYCELVSLTFSCGRKNRGAEPWHRPLARLPQNEKLGRSGGEARREEDWGK